MLTLVWGSAAAQTQNQGTPPAQSQPPVDTLGRDTPRGTVVGFLMAARRGELEVASQYLNIQASGTDASELAAQLFRVLDARLPPRLSQVSDAPQGSRSNPLRPDEDVVGVVSSAMGDVEIVLERVTRGSSGQIWLFSTATVAAVPALYNEVMVGWSNRLLPSALATPRGTRLFEWTVVLLVMPIVYLLTVVLNRALTPSIRWFWRKLSGRSVLSDRSALPTPVRLLILALAIRWTVSALPLSLLIRQFWSNVASLFTIAGIVWVLIFLNGEIERHVQRRFPRLRQPAAATLVRLLRRVGDLLVIFTGLLAILRHFGVDATPALAGLGVGGIAVALAAQKTLENVIAGASLVFDQAVRVGDTLKIGEVQGTVDHIGLRSTRMRTPDRTVVSVPNSQIANMSLETLSARDKFWFHPVIGIGYETRPQQLRAVVDGIRRLLNEHPLIERESVRVRFVNLGRYSLDIDIFGTRSRPIGTTFSKYRRSCCSE